MSGVRREGSTFLDVGSKKCSAMFITAVVEVLARYANAS